MNQQAVDISGYLKRIRMRISKAFRRRLIRVPFSPDHQVVAFKAYSAHL